MSQPQLDAFRDFYNQRRPQSALDRQTPAAVFNSRLKARPIARPSLVDHRVGHDKVDRFDKLTLRYLGRGISPSASPTRAAKCGSSSPVPTSASSLRTAN